MGKGDWMFAAIFSILAIVFIILIGSLIYAGIFNILVPYPEEYIAFCHEMGLDYHHSFTTPIDADVTCSRTIEDCPANNCRLIVERILFNQYPEKVGEVV